MKLQPKHFTPYLPYELEMCRQVTRTGKDLISRKEYYGKGKIYSYIGSVTPYIVWETNLGTGTKNTYMSDFTSDSENKLFLRPLSDLYKEIEHNEEVFIPIIQLAKIGVPSHFPTYGKGMVNFSDGYCSVTMEDRDTEKKCVFMFLYDTLSFSATTKVFSPNDVLVSQFPLYNLLLEWNFDLFGLIEAGLAIEKEQ